MSVEEQSHSSKMSKQSAGDNKSDFTKQLAIISFVWVAVALAGGIGLVAFSDVFATLVA